MKKENMGKPGGTLPPRPNSKWTNPFSSLLEPETFLFPRDDSTPDSAPPPADEANKATTSGRTSNDTTNNSNNDNNKDNNSGAVDTPGRSGNAQPPSTMMMMPAGGVSPSGDFDDLDIPSTSSSRESTGVPPPNTNNTASAAESADRYQQQQQHGHHNNNTQGVMVDQHLGPVDRLLLLVADGQSLSRRVLGNERQSARLGERLSALKNPLWQLQARVRTQAEQPPEFIHTLAEQVSHCLDVLLELTHPDWWNQIRRKVRREEALASGRARSRWWGAVKLHVASGSLVYVAFGRLALFPLFIPGRLLVPGIILETIARYESYSSRTTWFTCTRGTAVFTSFVLYVVGHLFGAI